MSLFQALIGEGELYRQLYQELIFITFKLDFIKPVNVIVGYVELISNKMIFLPFFKKLFHSDKTFKPACLEYSPRNARLIILRYFFISNELLSVKDF